MNIVKIIVMLGTIIVTPQFVFGQACEDLFKAEKKVEARAEFQSPMEKILLEAKWESESYMWLSAKEGGRKPSLEMVVSALVNALTNPVLKIYLMKQIKFEAWLKSYKFEIYQQFFSFGDMTLQFELKQSSKQEGWEISIVDYFHLKSFEETKWRKQVISDAIVEVAKNSSLNKMIESDGIKTVLGMSYLRLPGKVLDWTENYVFDLKKDDIVYALENIKTRSPRFVSEDALEPYSVYSIVSKDSKDRAIIIYYKKYTHSEEGIINSVRFARPVEIKLGYTFPKNEKITSPSSERLLRDISRANWHLTFDQVIMVKQLITNDFLKGKVFVNSNPIKNRYYFIKYVSNLGYVKVEFQIKGEEKYLMIISVQVRDRQKNKSFPHIYYKKENFVKEDHMRRRLPYIDSNEPIIINEFPKSLKTDGIRRMTVSISLLNKSILVENINLSDIKYALKQQDGLSALKVSKKKRPNGYVTTAFIAHKNRWVRIGFALTKNDNNGGEKVLEINSVTTAKKSTIQKHRKLSDDELETVLKDTDYIDE